MRGENNEDLKEETNEKEIDILKKYNRKMFILKVVAIVLSILIISMWGILVVDKVQSDMKLKKAQYISEIIDKAYNRAEEVEKENYTLTCEYNQNSTDGEEDFVKSVYSHKDGYFKEEHHNYTNYGITTKNETYYIQFTHEEEEKKDYKGGLAISFVGYNNNMIDLYRKENILDYRDYNIREEELDGIVYYVIKITYDKIDGYEEIWINKDSMLLFKETGENGITRCKYTWTINNVKDEDVRINYLEGYGENERLQKVNDMFERIKRGEFDTYYQVMKWEV